MLLIWSLNIAKNLPNFIKSSQNSFLSQKCQNLYIKSQFESPKHLHLTTFGIFKDLQQIMFKTTDLGENLPFLWATSSIKKSSKSSPIDEKSPNLVTLRAAYPLTNRCVT